VSLAAVGDGRLVRLDVYVAKGTMAENFRLCEFGNAYSFKRNNHISI
jgi:hypothetical protein